MADEGVAAKVPKIDAKTKKILIPVLVVAAAYVGWRYYSASGETDDSVPATGNEFGDTNTDPSGVLGAVSPTNSYGSTDGQEPVTTSDYGFTGKTNAQWTQYVTTQLQQSDRWSYTDIVEAVGNYLNNKPLTTAQQSIVQAAIAVGGYPPSGSHTIISGGNTALTVAPTGVKVGAVTDDSVTLTYSAVPGAVGYRAYRGLGASVGSSSSTSMTLVGLRPNTSYAVGIKAVSGSGTEGPMSTKVTAKTKGTVLKAPGKPRVSSITKTTAHVTSTSVAGAEGYNWYVNNIAHGHSDSPSYGLTGLKSKTSYQVSVRADTSTGAPGPTSATTSFKTK